MEGFSLTPSSAGHGITVPYVAKAVSRLEPARRTLIEFPTVFARSENDDSYLDASLAALSPRKLVSLLQSWLFFELLEQFFGHQIRHADFTRAGESRFGRHVHMSEDVLWSLFGRWRQRMTQLPHEERRQIALPRHKEVLVTAATLLEPFDDPRIYHPGVGLSEVAFSVRLLIFTLDKFANEVFSEADSTIWTRLSRYTVLLPFQSSIKSQLAFDSLMKEVSSISAPLLPPGCEKPSNSARLILDKFVENNWCFPQAVNICQSYDVATVNYLSFLHQKIPRHINHLNCTSNHNLSNCRCVAHDGFTRVLHIEDNCECPMIGIQFSELSEMIQNDEIPLIEMDLDSLDLRLVRGTPWMSYIAISYVSSDGLLNRHSNSLPKCQLQHIKECLTPHMMWRKALKRKDWSTLSRRRTILFWMDTICIPAQSPMTRPVELLKANAIGKMAAIYGAATFVLVLNRQLQGTVLTKYADGSTNEDELAGQILMSPWMMRAWTLQEGVLANSCEFRIMTRLVAIRSETLLNRWSNLRRKARARLPVEAYKARIKLMGFKHDHSRPERLGTLLDLFIHTSVTIPRVLHHALQDDATYIKRLSEGSKRYKVLSNWRISQFVRARNSLLKRSVTEERDRLSIFANLLDFNSGNVSRIREEDHKLPHIIRSCERLPLSLLYNGASKLIDCKDSPDGWLPTKIDGDPLSDQTSMRLTDQGLQVEKRGVSHGSTAVYMLHHQFIPSTGVFLLRDAQTGQVFSVEIIGSNDDDDILHFEDQSYCLFFDKSTGTHSRSGYAATGAILRVRTFQHSTYHLQYRAPVRLWHPDSAKTARTGVEPPLLECTDTFGAYEYFIDCDQASWALKKRLPRREPVTDRPVITTLVAAVVSWSVFVWITTVLRADFVAKSLFPNSALLIQMLALVVYSVIVFYVSTFWIYSGLMRFFRLLHYVVWLETFRDDWNGGQGNLSLWRALMIVLRSLLPGSKGGRSRRSTTGESRPSTLDIAQGV